MPKGQSNCPGSLPKSPKVAKGLPDEMIKLATEKTQEIKEAYELIKKHRGND